MTTIVKWDILILSKADNNAILKDYFFSNDVFEKASTSEAVIKHIPRKEI